MKSSPTDPIFTAIDDVLVPHGFTRRAKSWYLANAETVLVVNLQKGLFNAKTNFINLGVSLRVLSEALTPKINLCQISARLEMLVEEGKPSVRLASLMDNELIRAQLPQISEVVRGKQSLHLNDEIGTEAKHNRPKIDVALDLQDTSMTNAERKTIIAKALETVGVPFLKRCDSLQKICRALRTGALNEAAVWQVVHNVCALSETEGKRKGKRKR